MLKVVKNHPVTIVVYFVVICILWAIVNAF